MGRISAVEAPRFVQTIADFTEEIRRPGFSQLRKGGVKIAKPKVAFYWCASCGGCEETVVDLNENLLKVADAVDIVL